MVCPGPGKPSPPPQPAAQQTLSTSPRCGILRLWRGSLASFSTGPSFRDMHSSVNIVVRGQRTKLYWFYRLPPPLCYAAWFVAPSLRRFRKLRRRDKEQEEHTCSSA